MTLTDDAVKKCLQQERELENLRAQLAEARKIIEYVRSCDLQIMENGYEAEDRADTYLKKYPA